ncbi:hypothetical protein PBRA_007356, partial [Plasmodiophora brassicae]
MSYAAYAGGDAYEVPHGAAAAAPSGRFPVLKEVSTSSTVAWCPLRSHPALLAAGTVTGTIDDSFQTSSRLQIFDASLADPHQEMPLLGQAKVKDVDFVRLGWGKKGSSDGSYGLIAGGMSDGSVLFWNARDLIEGSHRAPVVAKRHAGPVAGLAFHPTEPNLIASGAEAELLIWDLKNPSSPTCSPYVHNSTDRSGIVDLAWNMKVPHILACSTSAGATNVWNLKEKRAIFSFHEASHRHISATAVAWDPSDARQLVVAYASPVAEVWDLRYALQPLVVLQNGHSRGSILTAAWSQHDSTIIVTSGEDAQTCMWNARDGSLLDSVKDPGTTFSMRWHPFNPELLATSTYEGKVAVRSLSNTGSHVPAWKGHPCGAIFGFGSRLVSFGNGRSPGAVRIHKVSTEPEFVRVASEFQDSVSRMSDLRALCALKMAQVGDDPDEQATWEFLQMSFEPDARARYLSRLGFAVPESARSPASSESEPPPPRGARPVQHPRIDEVSDEDFFTQLSRDEKSHEADPGRLSPTSNGPTSPSRSSSPTAARAPPAVEDDAEHMSPVDTSINNALVVGDLPGAARFCAKHDRMADALLIASLGDAALQAEIHALYIAQHRKHYIRSVAACVAGKDDMRAYVSRSDLGRWRETLALILTYAAPGDFVDIVRVLVDRLDRAGQANAAVTCC